MLNVKIDHYRHPCFPFTPPTNKASSSMEVNIAASISMYANLRRQFKETIQDVNNTLLDMALDPRLMPGVAAEMRSVRSSASTPSLRSREGSITPIGRMDAPGGNVRVVVRVRGFLPRGMRRVNIPLLDC